MVETKRYKRVLTFISLLFILILAYMTYFQVVKADKLKNSEDNKRNWVDDNKLKRGNILDSKGNILLKLKLTIVAKNIDFSHMEKFMLI